MNEAEYEKAIETLSILIEGMGAGIAAWGVINLIEAYRDETANKEVAGEYRRRISQINSRVQRLTRSRDTGKISKTRYQRRLARYEAEQTALLTELAGMDAEIKARKKEGLQQIVRGASFTGAAPLVCDTDTFTAVTGGTAQP
jgi:PAS domain-containing protein